MPGKTTGRPIRVTGRPTGKAIRAIGKDRAMPARASGPRMEGPGPTSSRTTRLTARACRIATRPPTSSSAATPASRRRNPEKPIGAGPSPAGRTSAADRLTRSAAPALVPAARVLAEPAAVPPAPARATAAPAAQERGHQAAPAAVLTAGQEAGAGRPRPTHASPGP